MITNSQIASIESKFARYKEELEEKIITKAEGDKEKVNLLDENVKSYIPSFDDNDVGKFAVIGGELYYLGDNELSKKAAKNQKMEVIDESKSSSEFAQEVEKKALDGVIKSKGITAFKYTETENSENKEYIGGIPLYDKNYQNKEKWKVVTEVENNELKKTYGTDWYYVPKNTEIEGLGKAKKDYIINYNTSKEIEFNKEKHTLMGFDKTMAVNDHVLFNADPSIFESYKDNSEDFDSEVLGEGVEFYGYTEDDTVSSDAKNQDLSKAITGTSFLFDGKNDIVTFPFSGGEDSLENGFVFEFYGKVFNDRYTFQQRFFSL